MELALRITLCVTSVLVVLLVLLHRAKQSFKSLYLKNMSARPPGVVTAGKL